MQEIQFIFPAKGHIQWIEDRKGGRGSVEVGLQLTLQRYDEWEHWQIVEAVAADIVPYVMSSKMGVRCEIVDDWPEAWLDWCKTPEFLKLHGADIEKMANEQWAMELEEA